MRLGIFLNFEHGRAEESRDAFRSHIDLAVQAERCGLEEVWVSEHHFNAFSQSGGFLPILGHLAALTTSVRLGTARTADTAPRSDPRRGGSRDHRSAPNGRLNLGMARGGPFPLQYEHFHIAAEDAPAQAREAGELLLALLAGENVSFEGRWYSAKDVTSFPRPLQKPLPVFIAS